MKKLKLSIFLCVLATVLTAMLLTAQVAAAASLSWGKWSIVPSPNAEFSSILSGVAAISANNVWAVGNSTNSSGFAKTLTENWNGSSWMVVPSPNPGSGPNSLSGVAAISANDIWAVGNSANSKIFEQTLTEHWNGSSWMVVPSPNVGSGPDSLLGVAAISANDIWAVGNTGKETLIEHWNGSSWMVVPSSSRSYQNFLYGVAAVSANDIWAVGISSFNFNNHSETLTEHWNGSNWKIVTSPNASSGINLFTSVAAVSANDIWAVGAFISSGMNLTLAEHWNGSGWMVVPSPNVRSSFNELTSVAAVSANNIWAVGEFVNSGGFSQTLTEHWNGSSWVVVPSPNVGNGLDNILSGTASILGSGDIWAVGNDGFNEGMGADNTLTEFHSQVT